MKSKMFRASRPSFFAALVLGVLWTKVSAVAQETAAQTDPASIQVTMPTNGNAVMQHQPIVLHYDIFNPNPAPLFLESGTRDMDGALGSGAWMEVSLIDELGHSVPAQQEVHGLPTSGFGVTDLERVEPESHFTGAVVASRWFKTPVLGKYTLVLVVEQKVFRFPVTIVADDHTKLKALAKQIGLNAGDVEDAELRRSLMQAVCVLPAQDALPVWQQLSNSPKCRAEVGRELARKPSENAADILAKSVWSGDAGEELDSSRVFDTMYNEGDVGLRAHIKTIFAKHGDTNLPEKLIVSDAGG